MKSHTQILIVGGGLAGLTSAIHLAKANISVVLIEKNTYPKHKVCGEYISNEILPYFDFLGIELNTLHPTQLSKFEISTQKGDRIHSKLPLGGFGISRYTLDHYLWNKAKSLGVTLLNDQVTAIHFNNDIFTVQTSANQNIKSDYVIGAYGKRSILDKKLDRSFSTQKSPWLAVKAHYKGDFDPSTVALHNFEGGYCGLSMVENGAINACYLVNYKSFKTHKNITSFQENVMYNNPNLKTFFENSTLLFDSPLTISQINFDQKKPVTNHIFMTGDAAGVIHPLCGNGMAMAIQSAQILCDLLIKNYSGVELSSRKNIEQAYTKKWNAVFSRRLYAGRVLQKIVLHRRLQQVAQKFASTVPAIVPTIIRQTHGKPIIC